MKLSKLVYEGEAIKIVGDRHVEVKEITTNVSFCAEGALLVAIKNDVLLHLSELQFKFSAIICNEEIFETLCKHISCTLVCVKSPRRAWALAESRIRQIDYTNMRFIAVTGTNGKTTTATIIKHILESNGSSVGFIGTGVISIGKEVISGEYYSMTTPDPPQLYDAIKQMSERRIKYVVMEVSSHSIHYEKVSAIKFELSVFTNLSSEHLDFHHTVDEYAKTKLKLINQSERVILNIDDPVFRKAYHSTNKDKRSSGILWDADFRATDLRDLEFDGVEFIFRGQNFSFAAKSHLIGKFNTYNALSALSATISLGVAPCVAKRALASFRGASGRTETVYNKDFRVIIDYAHTDTAFDALLSSVKAYSNGRLSVLFGCGGDRYTQKRAKMAAIAEKYASCIYVTSDNQRSEPLDKIFSDIIEGFSNKCNYFVIENRSEAIRRAIFEAKKGDTLLLVGKGSERYNITSDGYHHFDERDAVKSAIEERGSRYESES